MDYMDDHTKNITWKTLDASGSLNTNASTREASFTQNILCQNMTTLHLAASLMLSLQ